MRERDNIIPQKLFASISSVPSMTSATNSTQADMMIVASSGTLFQVNSTGGSTAWGDGGTGGVATATGYATSNTLGAYNTTGSLPLSSMMVRGEGVASVGFSNGSLIINAPLAAADGNNAISVAGVTTYGGSTAGSRQTFASATYGLYAGSNILLTQSSDSIGIVAAMNLSAGGSTGTHSAVVFGASGTANVNHTYDTANSRFQGRAFIRVTNSVSSANVSSMLFSAANGLSFLLSTDTTFGATLSGSLAQNSLSFVDSNGISFGASAVGSTTTITARASANVYATGTNTISSSSTTMNLSSIVFSGVGGASVGVSGQTIYVSGNTGGGGGGGGIAIADTAATLTTNTVVFSNSNNVSFGLGTGASSTRMTASIPAYSLEFVNSNGVTFGTAVAGSTTSVTASAVGVADGGNVIVCGTRSATSVGEVVFSNSNGISFGLNTVSGSVVTASYSVPVVPAHAFSAAGGQSNYTTLIITDTNGVYFTNTGGSLGVASVQLQMYAVSNTTQSSTGSANHTALSFGGAGAVSVGVTNGSVIVSAPNTVAQTNQSLGIYGSSQTTGQSSSSTYDARSLSVVGAGGVSVGWSNSSLIISGATGGGAADGFNRIAAGTRTATSLGTVLFDNANGITFGMDAVNGSVVTASHNALTSQSNQAFSALGGSSAFQTLDFLATNGVTFTNTGGSIGIASIDISGTVIANSTGTSTGRMPYSNFQISGAGAVSVGWGNGTLVISAPNTIAQTNQSLGIYGSSQTTGQSSSSTYDARSLSIVGRGAVSVGWSNSSLLVSAPDTIAQTNQSLAIYVTSNSTGQSSSSTYDARSLSIVGDGIVSAGWSNSTLRISATQSNQAYNVGGVNATFQTVSFGDTNGVSWTGSNGSVIIGTLKNSLYLSGANTFSNTTGTWNNNSFVVSGAGVASVGLSGQTLIVSAAAAAGDGVNVIQMFTSTTGGLTSGASTSWSTGTFGLQAGSGILLSQTSNSIVVQGLPNSLVFSNSNNATFGTSTAGSTTTVTVSAPVNFSAGTTSNNLTNVVFSNSQNVVFGLNGSTITGGLQYISSYENIPAIVSARTQALAGASVSFAVAFQLPQPGSFSFLRIPCDQTSGSAVTLTTSAASLSASAQRYSTWNAVVYSLGTGASSKSLISVASGSCGETILNSISVAANGSEGSYTLAHTYPNEGYTTDALSTQYSITGTVYSFTSNQIASRFTGSRMLDIPFANSLSAGPYWLIFGYSSSSAANSARVSAATSNWAGYSNHYGVSQPNAYYIKMGGLATSGEGLLGAGSFSTAGGGTTSILPIANISSSASNLRPYFQLLRSA